MKFNIFIFICIISLFFCQLLSLLYNKLEENMIMTIAYFILTNYLFIYNVKYDYFLNINLEN